ncbi:MAG: DUF4080 domain-containing protein [Clostridia bacterium]|nr:DUF4080 domain-containing protein [Clostridia bacterium]
MKTLLVTLNSKFTHTSLALRCLLRAYPKDTRILECTVNQPKDEILRQILSYPADVYAFSVYIFNVTLTCQLLSDLRKIKPHAVILCGGPEVSYDCESFLRTHPYVDGILRGEGEETFAEVMEFLSRAEDPRAALSDCTARGLSVFSEGEYRENPDRPPLCDLDSLPFPYGEELPDLTSRILYYESSRGCPYTCIYCLSSVQGRVRFRSVERVCADLQRFLDAKVRLVKFVDRTFNCGHARALVIWKYLKEHDNGITAFHFEIAAWLLSEEEMALLESMRPGQILLEVGIQSTNHDTLAAITRKTDPEKLYANVARLSEGPCHVHTDLIAGLPYEDFASFEASFNRVFALKSHCLQLGFLKRLKGTALWQREDGAEYSDAPPYEILKNRWLSSEDLSALKGVEKVLEKYWNSGLCRNLLSWYSNKYPDGVFDFFLKMSRILEAEGEFYLSHTPNRAFALMSRWLKTCLTGDAEATAQALLCYDLFTFDRCHTPAEWQAVRPDRERLLELLKSGRVEEYLTDAQREVYRSMNSVQWLRNADLATFPCAPDGTPGSETHLFLYGKLRISVKL